MDYKDVIIEESLIEVSVIKDLNILQEKVKSIELLITKDDLNEKSLILQKGKNVFLKVNFI